MSTNLKKYSKGLDSARKMCYNKVKSNASGGEKSGKRRQYRVKRTIMQMVYHKEYHAAAFAALFSVI